MTDESFVDNDGLNGRYRQYLFFRLLIVVLSFGMVAFYQVWSEISLYDYAFFYLHGALVLYLTYAISAWLLFERMKARRLRIFPQLLIDILFQSSLVGLSGGVISIFSPVLIVTLVASTGIVSARGSYILASLIAVVLSLITFAYALNVFPAMWEGQSRAFGQQSSALLIASIIGLYMVAALGSKYSCKLRRMEGIQGIQSVILENMDEGLIAVDAGGQILRLNKQGRNLFQLDRAERSCEGVPLEGLLPEDCCQDLTRALEEDGKTTFRTVLIDRHGSERPIEVKVSSVKSESGETRCRIALLHDLTLQHEMEVAEEKIQKLEDMHVMALGIAHEIRNPLASIRGCVQELSKFSTQEQRQLRYMDIVCRESDRLDSILEDFLRYARPDPVKLVRTSLLAVIDEAVLLLRNRDGVEEREIGWQRPAGDVSIQASRDQLIQLFLNLGLNSIEATDPQTGRISIRVGESTVLRRHPDLGQEERVPWIEVQWSNNGPGLTADERARLFTPFFSTKEKGSGLGLSIVARIVREHQGTIDVSGTAETGTVFSIRFPVSSSSSGDIVERAIEEDRESAEPCYA